MKQKITALCILSLLLFSFTLNVHTLNVNASENAPVRIINVVYDDSGSMINTGGELVDTWCQAKYSMEVFAAMLGGNDTMNVYVMSEYDKGVLADKPRLTLKGSSGPETNVKAVHDMITHAGNTPFDTVRVAHDDLAKASADEKWLVILTDGEFEDGAFTNDQVNEYLAGKASDVRVMFLGMGANAAEIKASEESGIFYEKAKTNDQILNKITEICTRIFNSNKLEVNTGKNNFSFDVPMSELVVFAQGEGVSISGITTPDGQTVKYDKTPVSVRYSDKPSSVGYENFIVDKELVGSIATFTGDFMPGDYTIEASNAKTIEVYYKPNVEITLYLKDADGNVAAYSEGVRAGEYEMDFGFVKAGTADPVEESKLLGNIKYSAYVSFNGSPDEKEYREGDKISIREGSYVIDAYADYLKYNSVSNQISFGVYEDKELVLTRTDSTAYDLDQTGFLNAGDPITYEITLEGASISAADWENFNLPVFKQTSHADKRVSFKVEKDSQPGVFHIYPSLPDGKATIGDYGNIDYEVSVYYTQDKAAWSGKAEDTCVINDQRNWFWRHIDKVIKLAVAGAIAFLLLGYVPGFKKYLPKKLKKMPTVSCESNVGARRQWEDKGRFTKKRMSTITPYRAERGTIRYLPRGVSLGPSLQVKATGSNRMEVTNTKAFAGKDFISFNGSSIGAEERKKKEVTAGLRIRVESRETSYTCVLNK